MDSLEMIFKGEHRVRVLVDALGAPTWVAKDVCEVLELAHVGSALRHLDEDEKGVHIEHTLGGPQEMATVTESGLYALIFRSRKSQAKAFRKWVTSEVLPEIRRRGSFGNVEMFRKMLVERQEADRRFWLARDADTNERLNRQALQIEQLRKELEGVRVPKPIGRHEGNEIRRRLREIAWRTLDLDMSTTGMSKKERRSKWLKVRKTVEEELRRKIRYPRDTGNSFDALPSDMVGQVHTHLHTIETTQQREQAERAKAGREQAQQKLFVLSKND